ncbi:DUF4304 domain-containing protein [Hymenobacter arizonensis]|uniref:DUF4304 domain-containing protein n=1 Tax=Hymenobacter arizonensis TaxID=1227077 RepID=A0A1I6BP57_HYMAR|nr:DUF4304 domain-containing protein [Hymenobacter arizonensis]SFQ82718.1 protein of unknown function [Hymenobacter arizonensis]
MSTTPTAAQAQFHHVVAQVLAPLLKTRGYRKSGSLFRFYDPSGWGKLVAVQKSAATDGHRVRFRLNLGVYLPETEWAFRGAAPTTPGQFTVPLCVVRTSVGRLDGSHRDVWYEASEQIPPEALCQQVAHDLTAHVLPFLDQFTSRQTVLAHLCTRARTTRCSRPLKRCFGAAIRRRRSPGSRKNGRVPLPPGSGRGWRGCNTVFRIGKPGKRNRYRFPKAIDSTVSVNFP